MVISVQYCILVELIPKENRGYGCILLDSGYYLGDITAMLIKFSLTHEQF